MSLGEFDLIRRYFTRPVRKAALGVGDDCALLRPTPGMQLAVSTDMLVQGRHFFPDVNPCTLGHKALAVNLSDLAACGAQPLAFTLALALPAVNEDWLAPFAQGLLALADTHGCELIGGDTTAGPLTISITVFGEVPTGQALLRSGARAGDEVWVSGTAGDAALALQALQGQRTLPAAVLQQVRQRLEQPTPRVALGVALRGIASAAVDVSDGLAADLGHILQQSGVGARIEAQFAMQLIAACADNSGAGGQLGWNLSEADRLQCCLAGGDDYELVFTASAAQRSAVQAAAQQAGVGVTRIGVVEAAPGLRVVDAQGQQMHVPLQGFDHFRTAPSVVG
jgi:thiamine-monophosphate kinase